MRTFSTKRKFGKKAALGMAAAITVGVASASLAIAQVDDAPEGDPGPPPAVVAAPLVTDCGSSRSSIVKTQNLSSTTSSVEFVDLSGATTVVNLDIPEGQTRCIKVLFTAETRCRQSAQEDLCFVRALDNGALMNPNGQAQQAIDGESLHAQGHAYEWVRRVGPGLHIIEIQRRVFNAATVFQIDDWTFDVQIHA